MADREAAGVIVRPNLMIRLSSGEVLWYEVVRSQPFWEKTLADKLARYRMVLRDIERTDYDGEETPLLILCAENEIHAAMVREVAEKSGLAEEDVFYTNDLQLFGTNFHRSLYHFNSDGKRQYFEFAL